MITRFALSAFITLMLVPAAQLGQQVAIVDIAAVS